MFELLPNRYRLGRLAGMEICIFNDFLTICALYPSDIVWVKRTDCVPRCEPSFGHSLERALTKLI